MWDYVLPGPSLDESGLALSAAYLALNRYIHGQDLYIVPTNLAELEEALSVFLSTSPTFFFLYPPFFRRRYCADAIHNYVAKSRSPLNPGGYSRVRHLSLRHIYLSNKLTPVCLSVSQVSDQAAASIMSLLASPHNAERLLSLHRSRPTRNWSTRKKAQRDNTSASTG
jgi:hypothetical protein